MMGAHETDRQRTDKRQKGRVRETKREKERKKKRYCEGRGRKIRRKEKKQRGRIILYFIFDFFFNAQPTITVID